MTTLFGCILLIAIGFFLGVAVTACVKIKRSGAMPGIEDVEVEDDFNKPEEWTVRTLRL